MAKPDFKDFDWTAHAKNLLKSEIKRKGMTYRQLAERLTDMHVPETERNLANKISRGGFTAAFFLACLEAMEVNSLRL